jgi:PAS domain S-box-containing protein
MGSNQQEIIGKSDWDFYNEESARSFLNDEQEIIRTGKPTIGKLEQNVWKKGESRWLLTSKLPLRDKDGRTIGTFGISKDVNALKETEDKLAHERDLLCTLLDNSPDCIYFKDRQSRFVRCSKAFEELFQVSDRSRFIGKTDFDFFTEEHARPAYEDEQEIIRTGKPILGKLEEETHPDGRKTWCLTTKLPWRDKDGNNIGTFGISKDFTALKKAEVELEAAHKRLIETSRLAGMAEVATDVLHNVGNVLNSVNVSCSLAVDRVKASKAASLSKVSALLEENRGRLGEFLVNDPRGQRIPGYLAALAEHYTGEQSALLQELEQLRENIEHIKQIVAMQQSYAKVAGVTETVSAGQLVEDALRINAAALARHTVQVRREFEETPPILTDKHRVLQILVNLIRNAKYALDDSGRPDRLMTLRIGGDGDGHVKIQVSDNGVGIPPENLTRIFGHGFTTRRNGHGFGLHSSALAVRELGGSIQAQSEGLGKGATFTLLLPHIPPARPT